MGTLPALCWNKKDILPPHMPDHRIMPPYRLNIPPLILPSPQYVLRRCDTLRRAHADSGSPLLHHRAVPEILLHCWSGTVRMPPQNLLSQVRSDMPDVQTCQCSAATSGKQVLSSRYKREPAKTDGIRKLCPVLYEK